MAKGFELKNKKYLYLYYAALAVVGVVALIILLTVTDYNDATIVNTICLCLTPIVFFLGYVDFKNFKPLTAKQRAAYIALGMAVLTICLVHYNVRNYNYLTVYTGTDFYNPIISIFVAASIAISFFSAILIFFHREEKHFQVKLFYATAIGSLVSTALLTTFNYATTVLLFDGVLWHVYREGFVVDVGMTILILRVFFEFLLFNVNAHKERKLGAVIREDSEYQPKIVKTTRIALAFLIINIVVLPILDWFATKNPSSEVPYLLYEIVEAVDILVLLSLGSLLIAAKKKCEKYGQIYKRMGVALLVYACVYLIMDYFPITLIFVPETEIEAIIIADVFHGAIKFAGLLFYVLYHAFNKKLKEEIRSLEAERKFNDLII
jgi:hypothetical protein